MIHGRNINILLNNTVVAVAKSCDISMSNETLEIASQNTGKWRKYIPGRNTWTITIQRFIQAVEGDLSLIGQEVSVKIADVSGVTNVTKMQGTAIVTECSITCQVGSMASGSMTLQGSDALTT